MKAVQIFEANDGARFDDANECGVYEQIIDYKAALGLRPSDIAGALAGDDRALGDILEKLGNTIARKRLEMGVTKRRVRSQDEPAQENSDASE